MESVGNAETLRRHRQKLALRERERGANFRVVRVVAAAERHNEVVRIVAAKKKNANQRLVVRGALRQRTDQTQPAEAGRRHSRRCRAACRSRSEEQTSE